MSRLLLTMLLLFSTFQACAAGMAGMFGQGHTQFSVLAGNGYTFDKNYFVFGAGISYYVVDGLGIGLSFERWSRNNPGITKYAPFVQYVFYQLSSSIQPYVGAFYRHTSVDGLPDINSIGERAGINIAAGSNAYISFGIVQEIYLNCQKSVYSTCSETYPDLGVTFGF